MALTGIAPIGYIHILPAHYTGAFRILQQSQNAFILLFRCMFFDLAQILL